MDDTRFDRLAVQLASLTSRRDVLTALAGTVALGLAARISPASAAVKRPVGSICSSNEHCASGLCGPRDATGRRRCAIPSACSVQFQSGPPAMAISTVQDADSGVVQILVTTSQNADTVVPPFIPATTDAIVVTSTKINQAEIAKVSFNVTNGDVFTSACSYEF